ncbi:MAG TPA: transposase [Terriglobia bacterium]|nr:transposase [Terriglobia bacterium]
MKFLNYSPDQGYLLPPTVESVLGRSHLCFYMRRMVEKLDLSAFESDYGEEGRRAYHPALRVGVWLYAYALGITRSKLRSGIGRAIYGLRKARIEPVFGVLKEQRGMRQFRWRGLEKVQVEWSLSVTAYNLTRMWNLTGTQQVTG